jgi:hypothetical protein
MLNKFGKLRFGIRDLQVERWLHWRRRELEKRAEEATAEGGRNLPRDGLGQSGNGTNVRI